MSTGAAAELSEFSRFIAEQLRRDADCSLEQAVQQFRGYQGQLAALKAKLAAAEDSAARGRVAPFDADELIAELDRELSAEGVPH